MDPGEQPEELQNLTFIEEQLIARVHPLVSVYKLKGLQLAYSGNVISFPQAIEEFVDELPKKVKDSSSVITVRFSSEKVNARDFQVRASKVHCALLWLKQNNPLYKNINISEENIKALPEDGNVYSEVQSIIMNEDQAKTVNISEGESSEDIHHSTVPITLSLNQDDQIKSFLNWPKMSHHPVDEYKTVGYIASAFPTLFPYGKADLRAPRMKVIQPANYFKHLMNYQDDRFSKHSTFRFFALNSIMRWNAIMDGNIFIQRNKDFKGVTVEHLKVLLTEKPHLMKKVMFQGSNLRGSKAYWHARCNELKDMVEQLSLPTFFLTLSAADLHWPDLYRILTDKDLSLLTEEERRKLLQSKPMVVDNFFDERIQCFIKHVLHPVYKVKDYWFRIEFQHRGSPHLHGVFWLEGAPDVTNLNNETEEKKAEILKYFNDLICAINPDPQCSVSDDHPCRKTYEDVSDNEEDLAQLLRTVQRHTKCSQNYCIRRNKKTGKEECRFHFPMEMSDKSSFSLSDTGKLEYIPARNDQFLNKFNPFILQLWRANMDISPVLSKEALISYLAKYISKCEPQSKGYEEIINMMLESMDDNDTAKKFLQKFFIKTCAERDLSAQEVCHILLGNKLYSSGGRQFTFLYISEGDDWVSVKNINENEVENEDGLQQTNFMEKYKLRPAGLENITLWEAALSYNPISWKQRERQNIVRVYPKYRLTDNEQDNEKYYHQMVLLHVPWRNEKGFCQETLSWKQIYNTAKIDPSQTVCCTLGNIEGDEETYEESDLEQPTITSEEWMIAASLAPHHNIPNIELGRRDIDMNYNWNEAYQKYKMYGSIEDFRNFINNHKTNENSSTSSHSVPPNVQFNEEQQKVISLMKTQVSNINAGKNDESVPKRIIIQGKAGTGKSLLIKFLTSIIEDKLGKDAYLLLASTGIAALNIGGQTVHSAFNLPKDFKKFDDLKGEAARNLSNKFANLKFIILDEYSMVGTTLLSMIDKRCRQGTGNYGDDFGGLHIYMLGDIRQLPPVMDSPVYSTNQKSLLSKHGKMLFDNFQASFTLQQCHRQTDERFQQLLDNVSVGDISVEDYQLLSTRFINNVGNNEFKDFDNALRIFATREEVHEYNTTILSNLKQEGTDLPVPVARIPAKHNCRTAGVSPSEDADGLEPILYPSKGCKIMLRQNVCTNFGLVNGAQGKVIDIIYEDGCKSPDDMPAILLCAFDSYKGPSFIPGTTIVPICPVSSSWVSGTGTKCTRIQFPISLAYACSIHKSQGMTLLEAVENIGPKEFALGLAYVALSRVKTLSGLLLQPFCFDRISKLKNSPTMTKRLECEKKIHDMTCRSI